MTLACCAGRYVRSEGIAAIVLKRSDLKDVPRWAAVSPYCTILNCGVNNDGFTKEGITFPSKNAQLALEKQVNPALLVACPSLPAFACSAGRASTATSSLTASLL